MPCELDGACGGGVFAWVVGVGVEDAVWFGLGVFGVFLVGERDMWLARFSRQVSLEGLSLPALQKMARAT